MCCLQYLYGMKKTALAMAFAAASLLLQHCSNPAYQPELTSDTVKFFPVNLYIQGQIARVDSLADSIWQINIDNNTGKKDTLLLTKQQFNKLAQYFLTYDISDKKLHPYYKENTFADATTQSFAFNYTALDNTLPLQTVDVLLDQTGRQLKNVFYNIAVTAKDSTIAEKAGWSNDKSFFINRETTYNNNKTVARQTIIVWKFQP